MKSGRFSCMKPRKTSKFRLYFVLRVYHHQRHQSSDCILCLGFIIIKGIPLLDPDLVQQITKHFVNDTVNIISNNEQV